MIKIICEKKVPRIIEAAANAAQTTDDFLDAADVQIDLSFLTKPQMRKLNQTQRGIDCCTDVLSFPFIEVGKKPLNKQNYPYDFDPQNDALMLGQIAICLEQAREQAVQFEHSDLREIAYLFVHGLMHLLGYDHQTEKQKALMRQKEEQVMTLIGQERE